MLYPLVSICLPAHNHENYVRLSLESVIQQTYPNIELHIVDDGSSDNTASVIKEWTQINSHTLPITFTSRPNKGICATLNELYSKCKGNFIAGLSSDDILTPNSISSRVTYLIENPDKHAVCCDFSVINNHGSITHKSGLTDLYNRNPESYLNPSMLRRDILRNFSFAGPVLMISQSGLKQLGKLDENIRFEDWDTYLRLSQKNKMGYVNEIGALYRLHEANFSRNQIKDVKKTQYERMVLERALSNSDKEDHRYIRKIIKKRKRKEFDFKIRSFIKKLIRH